MKSLVKNTTRNDLIYYLMFQLCIVDGKPIESFKSLDSYKKFKDGFLRDFCAMKIPGSFVLVKGLVSYCLYLFICYEKNPLNCWLVLTHDGSVRCGHFVCPAGYITFFLVFFKFLY